MTDILRDLPVDERPRERLLQHGASTLSDSELVAILLGSGMRGKNAIQVARELLRGGVTKLSQTDAGSLAKVPGIGPAKATRVVAALEFARRVVSTRVEPPPALEVPLLGDQLVKAMKRLTQERLGAVFLDTRGRVLTQRNDIYIGTINNAFVSTRDLIRHVMTDNATGIVIFHNHPSGDPTPSKEDRDYTIKLRDSMKLIDVTVVDHLIIGVDNYFSLASTGILNDPKQSALTQGFRMVE
jgi:DNA repair protein RadC